ncbi:uncharacterized protein TNCV_4509091 [Trichonephila clavipes]|nr:uncharacterized protein TNCV_4509091 [Trichonephila clavipes]
MEVLHAVQYDPQESIDFLFTRQWLDFDQGDGRKHRTIIHTQQQSYLYRISTFAGKKELIEWCMKEGLIASSYECPKCNDRHDVTWSAIKRFLRNCTNHAECMFDHYLAE